MNQLECDQENCEGFMGLLDSKVAQLPVRLFLHYYISIQNPTVASDGAWIFSFKPTKNYKVKFFYLKLWL